MLSVEKVKELFIKKTIKLEGKSSVIFDPVFPEGRNDICIVRVNCVEDIINCDFDYIYVVQEKPDGSLKDTLIYHSWTIYDNVNIKSVVAEKNDMLSVILEQDGKRSGIKLTKSFKIDLSDGRIIKEPESSFIQKVFEVMRIQIGILNRFHAKIYEDLKKHAKVIDNQHFPPFTTARVKEYVIQGKNAVYVCVHPVFPLFAELFTDYDYLGKWKGNKFRCVLWKIKDKKGKLDSHIIYEGHVYEPQRPCLLQDLKIEGKMIKVMHVHVKENGEKDNIELLTFKL